MIRVQLLTLVLGAVAALASCSVRPVYNDQEKALAQNGVDRFHERYNRRDYDGLYALMDANVQRGQPREVAVPAMQQTVETWGNEQATSMVFAKVFPGPPIQVRMIYNTTYEKGNAQEWFIWTSDGKQASLLQYQIFPGSADEKTIKSASSQ